MCDQQISSENINDTSETESEEWDLIQHKDVQISENTSDAESVEIISEEEAAQQHHSEQLSSDNQDSKGCVEFSDEHSNSGNSNNGELEGNSENPSALLSLTSLNRAFVNRDVFSRYFPVSNRTTSVLLNEPKETLFICLTIFIVGIAMLITPENFSFNKSPSSTQIVQEVDIATLLKELQMYRESNDHLKQQVKDLTEVINKLQRTTYESWQQQLQQQQQQQRRSESISSAKSNEHPTDQVTPPLDDERFATLIELIELYKELPFFLNHTTLLYNKDNQIQNLTVNDIFSKVDNESVQTSLDLFFKIPKHLKHLAEVVTQHKNIKPFIFKWGNKINKFSKSMENDITKMKLKFAKHLLKNLNQIMFSFYRKICNFEINKVIPVQECDKYNFNKSWKTKETTQKDSTGKVPVEKGRKNQDRKNGKKYNTKQSKRFERNKRNEEFSGHNSNFNVEVSDDSSEMFESMFVEESIQQYPEMIKKKFKKKELKTPLNGKNEFEDNKENFEKILEGKTTYNSKVKNRKRQLYGMNYSEGINSRQYKMDSFLCKKGYLLRCNNTEKASLIDSNWFLDMGNQRSKIRSHQSKGDWLFERARARREKLQEHYKR